MCVCVRWREREREKEREKEREREFSSLLNHREKYTEIERMTKRNLSIEPKEAIRREKKN